METPLTQIKYPFSAVVGHLRAKRALLLLAIDPGLRGVLIASENNSESTLARAFETLLPNAKDPNGDSSLTPNTEAVDLPLGITRDRLLGGLDLERTIATGRREFSAGILARADGRVLFVNDINLLDSETAAHVAHALDSGYVRVEREGLSAIHPAGFVVLGLFNPTEGKPSSLLLERVGLIVESSTECSASERAENIDRDFRFSQDPASFAEGFALESAQIMSVIEEARGRLRRVRVSKDQMRQMALIAMKLEVEGNRADVFALRAARANSALEGRDAVNEDDLVAAIQLVLVPRATTLPQSAQEAAKQNESSPLADSDDKEYAERRDNERESAAGSIEDLIIQATDSRVPEDLLSASQRTTRASQTGRRFKASPSTRGRYVHSTAERTNEAKVAFDATLRAAAPFQLRRWLKSSFCESGCPSDKGSKEASAGIRASSGVKLEKSDLRFKRFKNRSGALFIFAVDASGSMAVNRLGQAKGALIRLLGDAYLNRDQLALISFRGEDAEVLLAPTRSVEVAKRLVDVLPAGGGTPISAAVVKAVELARLARLRGMSTAKLVLFTDGRANVSLREGRTASTVDEELKQLGRLLSSQGITSTIVDTKSRFLSSGEGYALAQMLGARYFYLPRSDAEAVYNAIAGAAQRQVGKRTTQ